MESELAMTILKSFAQRNESSPNARFDGAERFTERARDFLMRPAAQERELKRVALAVRKIIESGGAGAGKFFLVKRLRRIHLDFEGSDFLFVGGVVGAETRAGADAIDGATARNHNNPCQRR